MNPLSYHRGPYQGRRALMSECNCEQTCWLNEKETAKTENGFSKIKCLHEESAAQDCGEQCLAHISLVCHCAHENCWLSGQVNSPARKGTRQIETPRMCYRSAQGLLASAAFSCYCPGSIQRGEPCDHTSGQTTRVHLGSHCSPPLMSA